MFKRIRKLFTPENPDIQRLSDELNMKRTVFLEAKNEMGYEEYYMGFQDTWKEIHEKLSTEERKVLLSRQNYDGYNR